MQVQPDPIAISSDAHAKARTFGDYELLEEIARGGMGVVYKARQRSLNRVVALKMILSGQFASKQEVLRFRSEAEAAANLRHPTIVAIYGTGESDGQHYFSMELVEGRSLAEIGRDGPLPAQRAARYAKVIAEAIHYAHQQGTLHRDLKPANILIDANDQPRVMDFGLAKRARGDFSLTGSGQMLGSPNYMPPEQARESVGVNASASSKGRDQLKLELQRARPKVGPYSDVYSLGATLYYLLTERPPFVAEVLSDTLHQLLNADPVPPRLLNHSVPPDLQTICLKCLEKEPDKGYPTSGALADELGRFLNDEPIRARPVSRLERAWRWCRRKPALATHYGGTSRRSDGACARWQAHNGVIDDLAFHPRNANWLATASGDYGLLKLWAVARKRTLLSTRPRATHTGIELCRRRSSERAGGRGRDESLSSNGRGVGGLPGFRDLAEKPGPCAGPLPVNHAGRGTECRSDFGQRHCMGEQVPRFNAGLCSRRGW